MSSSLLLDQQLADNIPGAVPGMPREAILDVVPRSALQATKRIVNLVPISASSVTSNQTLQFLIPQRNLAKAHSFYLKYRVTLPTILGNATKRFSFAGSMQSAASVINTISVQAGGTVIESCQNYHLWHNNVLSYTQRRDQLGFESPAAGAVASAKTFTDAGYTSGAAISNDSINNPYDAVGVNNFTIGATGAFSEVFSVPIGMGFFNPKESQFIPLFQLNGGVLLTIQTNAVAKAFSAQTLELFSNPQDQQNPAVDASTAAIINDYTLSDFELCYTEIQPSQSYVDAVRGGLAAGKLIRIEAQSYLNYQIACGSAIRQTLNLNCQSLAASFWGRVENLDSLGTSKFFVKQLDVNDSDSGATAASGIRYEMYYDNVLLFNSPNQLNYDTIVLRQLQEALTSSITDHNVSPLFNRIGQNTGTYTASNTTSNPISVNISNTKTYGSLASQQWLYGLSNKLFASNSTSMDGTPVGTVQIQFTTPGDLATNLWYFFFVYDYMYMVDANGAVSKVM
jgi:hypothetical protein